MGALVRARWTQVVRTPKELHRAYSLESALDELTFVLEHHWNAIGLTLSASDFTDAEAIAAVARITGGNFRLVQRLFAQITRILEINAITTISREVVETAREALIIGNS
ncbi:MAG: ATP-binding protein, partial [Vicinamibacteria bacterium]